MPARLLLNVAFVLALSFQAHAREYDAEVDIGLVANNPAPEVAARNTERLSAALNAQWPGGKFKFASGKPGPVLYPIRCAAKEFFFAGTIETSNRVGGCLYGGGGRSYMMMANHPTLTGMFTTFTRIGSASGNQAPGDKDGPVVRLRGTGFILDGINIMGRPWRGGTDYTGQKVSACIEVEGRANPATGCHTIRNCVLAEATYGIQALAGHYDEAGQFVADENHADQSTVEGVKFSGIGSCFRSENQQALGWSFRDIHVDSAHSGGATCVFDIVRGGNITASNVQLNHHQVTLLRTSDYSHNNQRISIEDVRFDGGYQKDGFLTLFEYAGKVLPDSDMSWIKWTLRISGHIPGSETQPAYDASKLVVIPDGKAKVGISRRDLLFDVARMPLTNFEPAGGPWQRPK
jgi:hypothetical protein